MVNKQINNKMAFSIIVILITTLVLYALNVRVCAPCTYQFNNRDYNKACSELCASTPKWKILLFNLTGINLDLKSGSKIMPKAI